MTEPTVHNIHISEILLEISKMTDVGEILRRMRDACADLGANRSSYHLTPKLHSQTDKAVYLAATGFPKPWLQLYQEPDFRKHDPIPDIIMQHGEPMLWQDALVSRRLTAEEQAFVRQLDAHGLHQGLGIPLFGPKGRNAYSSFTFDPVELLFDAEIIATITSLSLSAHVRICNILERKHSRKVRLSERENQVVQLIANGRSNKAIASDLNIEMSTTDTYVRRVFAKLGVSDRMGVSIKALELGILHL